jgi:class 3 adenylate cyclase
MHATVAESERPFVARVAERRQIAGWLTEAFAGEPRLIVVEGDAGIGKSRLLQWCQEHAAMAGARVLAGRAVEDVDVPYLCVRTALRDVPAAAAALEEQEHGDRWRTADWPTWTPIISVADAITAVARRQPVLLVIDDAQWADAASLSLLLHTVVTAGQGPAAAPLALVLARRLDDAPGPSGLVRLEREPIARRIRLDPLDEVAVNAMLRALTGRSPSRDRLHDAVERTGGIPLLVRAWIDDDDVLPARGTAVADQIARLVGRRLEELAPHSRLLLGSAAVLGDGTASGVAVEVAGLDTASVEEALDDLEDARLLRTDEGLLYFTHPLIRRSVLEQLGQRRLRRLHARSAAALAAGEPASGTTIRIADHLHAAGDTDPADLAQWARRAADAAFAAGAWSTSARLSRMDLDACARAGQPVTDPKRWYGAALAHFRDHDVHCLDLLRTAIELASAQDDYDAQAEALVLFVRSQLTLAPGIVEPWALTTLDALIDARDARATHWRPRLLGIAAECRFAVMDSEAGFVFAAAARRALGVEPDPLAAWSVNVAEGLQHLAGLDLETAEACFEASRRAAATLPDPWQLASSLVRIPLVQLARGRLDEVARNSAEGLALARANHDWAECSLAAAVRTAGSALRCSPELELDGAEGSAMYARSDYVYTPRLLAPALAYGRAVRGDVPGAQRALAGLASGGTRGIRHARMVDVLACMLEPEREPPELLTPPPAAEPTIYDLSRAAAAAEVAALRGAGDVLAAVRPLLATALEAGVVVSADWPHLLPRVLAQTALALGDDDVAVTLLDEAQDHAERMPAPFELARIAFLRADLLQRRGEHVVAGALLAATVRTADAHGLMTAVLDGHRRLGLLGASEHVELLARTVLQTDIVRSTTTTLELGDRAWAELLDDHDALVGTTVRAHGGVVFKHTGDGVYAWFAGADDAVECADALTRTVPSTPLGPRGHSIQIRAGLSRGTPVLRGGDLFGLALVEAARLCDQADVGGVLATSAVALACREPRLVAAGQRQLKGFVEPIDVYTVPA